MNVFHLFFCSRDEKVSFSCHSHLSKSCFLVRCLLKGPINISIRPGFLTFCHLLLTTVRTPAYLQSRGNWWCRGVQCPTPICPKIERKLSWKKNPWIFCRSLHIFDLPTALSWGFKDHSSCRSGSICPFRETLYILRNIFVDKLSKCLKNLVASIF